MTKTLTVATEVQKAVFENVLRGEIAAGFWKGARPADHADSWKDVQLVVGTELGASGFDIPRNYNFVNPDFFNKAEPAMMEVARFVDPNITPKKLKKHLISLNQIIGARLKQVGGPVSKLPRGRKSIVTTTKTETMKTITTVRKVAANIVEAEEPALV